MKTCPYCAEEIKDAAIRCPHCTSHLKKSLPHDASASLRIIAGCLAMGFGLLIFVGGAVAEAQEQPRYLAVTIYNVVLGLGFILTAIGLWSMTGRGPSRLFLVAILYIACTVVNEIAQLLLGVDAMFTQATLSVGRALFDIIMWSGIPAIMLVLAARIRGIESAAKSGPALQTPREPTDGD